MISWQRFVDFISIWKVRVNYAGGYVTMVTMCLLLADVVQRRLALKISMIYLLIIIAIIILFFSWFLDRFRFYTSEQNYSTSRNEYLKDIVKRGKE